VSGSGSWRASTLLPPPPEYPVPMPEPAAEPEPSAYWLAILETAIETVRPLKMQESDGHEDHWPGE